MGNLGMASSGVHGLGGANHHSLSMFDSEAQLMPLQPQMSHNAIIQQHNLSQNYVLGQNLENSKIVGLNK